MKLEGGQPTEKTIKGREQNGAFRQINDSLTNRLTELLLQLLSQLKILFIIFDLELSFLFPFATCFSSIGVLGFYSMLTFLIILTVGFVYE